ncbi:MAG TPA: Flp family type IVb pilin [Xanthobacteraceae bacterium]|nr:Flp family type IVb pilin [Xanthobacteraceae bacterium]
MLTYITLVAIFLPAKYRIRSDDAGASPMQKLLTRFAEDESGATAIEYALIVAALSVAIGAVLQRIAFNLDSVFTTLKQDTIIIFDGV